MAVKFVMRVIKDRITALTNGSVHRMSRDLGRAGHTRTSLRQDYSGGCQKVIAPRDWRRMSREEGDEWRELTSAGSS